MSVDWLLFFRGIKRKLTPFACLIGVIFNIVLFYLIRYKCTAQMKTFRKALYLTCLSEMAFSAYNTVFVLTLMVQGDTYYAIIEGVLGPLPRGWSLFGFSVFLIFIYTSVTNNTAVFVYRYLTFCRGKTVNTLKFLLIVAVGWLVVFIYVVIITIKYSASAVTAETFQFLNGTEFPADGSFNEFITVKLVNIANYCMFYAVPMVTLSYVGIIIMSFIIWIKFRRMQALMSTEQKRFHLEVSVVLWVEAATPFVTVVVPIYIDLSKVFITSRSYDWIAEFVWLLTLIGPSFTATVKILSIQAFRKSLFRATKNMYRLAMRRSMIEDSHFSHVTVPDTSIKAISRVGCEPSSLQGMRSTR